MKRAEVKLLCQIRELNAVCDTISDVVRHLKQLVIAQPSPVRINTELGSRMISLYRQQVTGLYLDIHNPANAKVLALAVPMLLVSAAFSQFLALSKGSSWDGLGLISPS